MIKTKNQHLKKYLLICFLAGSSAIANAQSGLFKASVLTPVNSFTSGIEGPGVAKNGTLYAVNIQKQGTIGQILPNGQTSIFLELPEGSIGNGIRFNSFGDMLIADYVKHNIWKVDMNSKKLSLFATEPRMKQPNDIAIDSKNRLYASDPNWKENTGSIWRIDNDGKVTLLEDNMGTANGIEVSPDNKTLYINESVQRNVWKYDLAADGSISNKKLLIKFDDFGMDGMRCDSKGNLYIARYGKGVIAKISPAGKVLQEIKLTGKSPTNVAFGGKDGKTIYTTLQDQGNIETFKVDISGQEWQMAQHQKAHN